MFNKFVFRLKSMCIYGKKLVSEWIGGHFYDESQEKIFNHQNIHP